MTGPSPPTFLPRGYATVYLIVPPGSFHDEFNHVIARLKRETDRPDGIMSETPEVLFLLGQARFAVRVEASDYRDVLERAYPDRQSRALLSNAVFSTPYVQTSTPNSDSPQPGEGMIRFLTHLRVRRTVYAQDPVTAEALIIDRLRHETQGFDEASIEAGLGWADFVVSGAVRASNFDALLSKLVEFNRIRIDPADECVFKRSLTLIGYDWRKTRVLNQEQPPGYSWTDRFHPPRLDQELQALMFIRARPGRLLEVKALLEEILSPVEVALVDGKIDVIGSIGKKQRSDFFARHEALSEVRGVNLIEKFETHVVFQRDLTNNGPTLAAANTDCACVEAIHPKYEITDSLPTMYANAVRNIEFLFHSTMRDSANCCDARNAILACEASLRRLLILFFNSGLEIGEITKLSKDDNEKQNAALRAGAITTETLRRIDRWVRTSERILRQRTVGSFEEFLGQSDRAVSYRGGAQKILTVADNLMNDFYAKMTGKPPQPVLTSLYDSVDRIQHAVGTGFVRMPVRALFFLPGVVPDLWHEVGGYHFFKEIFPWDLGIDFNRSKDELYEELADYYGDLVSFLYGFKLDLEQFGTALIEGWLASLLGKTADVAQQITYFNILARIVAICEFLQLSVDPIARELLEQPDSKKASHWRRVVLEDCYQEVLGIVDKYKSVRLPALTDVTRSTVFNILEAENLVRGLRVLRDRLNKKHVSAAVKSLDTPVADDAIDFEAPAELRVFTPKSDLNDAFRRLYWAVMMERRGPNKRRPNAFAFTAALTRGAALEYHRRAAR